MVVLFSSKPSETNIEMRDIQKGAVAVGGVPDSQRYKISSGTVLSIFSPSTIRSYHNLDNCPEIPKLEDVNSQIETFM